MEARRAAPDLHITVVEKSGDISYGACGIPYVVSGHIPALERLVVHPPEYFRERHQIALHLHTEATEILPAKSVVLVRDATNGEERELDFTNLVIASGASAVCPPLAGHDLAGVFVVRHLNDARRLLSYAEAARPQRAVVVGAGYIGLEMAEAFRARGLHTTIIEASDKVMSTIDGAARDRVADELRAHGVEIIFGEKVSAFEGGGGGRVSRVVTENGRAVEAEIVVIGVGVRPDVELARSAGLRVGESGALVTDERMQTSATNVYAAGDCCEVPHLVSGRRVWFPLGQPAVKQGWTAGRNAANSNSAPTEKYEGVVGTNVIKLFDLEIARTGLSLEEARRDGFDAEATESESNSRAGYYPGGSKIVTRLVTDRRNGRLLGAQMTGREGVAHRIDVFAAALHARLTADDISRLDLAYAPPFAPTIDPILRAAHKAK